MIARLTLMLSLLMATSAYAQSETPPAASEPAAAPDSTQSATPTPPPRPPEPPSTMDRPAPAPAELPTPANGATDEVTVEEWNRDDWMLMKPKVSLIELDGYLRLRADMIRRINFGNNSIFASEGRLPANGGGDGNNADAVGANMRLRLEPQINITDKIQIVTTFDIMDNMVLGSTPDTLPLPGTPVGADPDNILARTQLAPEANRNSITDSFRVKRVYGRVTALSEQLELKFGRMPNHWGLGMLANSGDCLDCDFGDSVDRVAVSFKAIGHVFTGMFDWVSNGPVRLDFGRSGGQPLDAVNWDDVFQYSLQIQKTDHPDDIKKEVRDGDWVLNYGLWNIIRFQYRDVSSDYYTDPTSDPSNPIVLNDPAQPLPPDVQRRRDAAPIYTGDAWLRLHYGKLELAAETALVVGKFQDRYIFDNQDTSTELFMVGGAFEALYRFAGDLIGTELALKAGAASGDSAPGFGALSLASTQRGTGGRFGDQRDRKLNNFQFSPDYHVDLLMFRHVIGTVTDAWYIRPSIAYQFSETISGSFATIYSQTFFNRSTPSCADETGSRCRTPGSGVSGSKPLGLEFDAQLVYGDSIETIGGRFQASLASALLFPFGAFRNPEIVNGSNLAGKSGKFAWTLQGRLTILF